MIARGQKKITPLKMDLLMNMIKKFNVEGDLSHQYIIWYQVYTKYLMIYVL